MTRLATLAISLAVLVGMASSCLVDVAQQRPYRTLTLDLRLKPVAVIGDSYTTGTDEGGLGPNSWTAIAWRTLTAPGLRIASDVAAEGRAGYAAIGDHGSIFADLAATAVQPEDALVVFFGSRNDRDIDPVLLAERARETFDLARRLAPFARFLVIGPPWLTADVPEPVLVTRGVLAGAAQAAGADFVDPIDERWFVDRPELIGADGVHPNDAGHLYLADKIAPLIRWQLAS